MKGKKKGEQSAQKQRGDGKQKPDDNLAILHATAGAFAGAVARFVVGPLDVLKIRFQVQLEPLGVHGAKCASKYTSMRQAVVTIVKEEGIQVCTVGVNLHQILLFPSMPWFFQTDLGTPFDRFKKHATAGLMERNYTRAAPHNSIYRSPVCSSSAMQKNCAGAWP